MYIYPHNICDSRIHVAVIWVQLTFTFEPGERIQTKFRGAEVRCKCARRGKCRRKEEEVLHVLLKILQHDARDEKKEKGLRCSEKIRFLFRVSHFAAKLVNRRRAEIYD